VKARSNHEGLEHIVQSASRQRHIYGALFHVSSGDDRLNLISASGDFQEDSRYYIASINKLFISALILRLITQHQLDLHDKISAYLPDEVVEGLHVYRGHDYSYDLSIAHLLSQTSGLPCYLLDKQSDGKRAMTELEAGHDHAWPMDSVLGAVKQMKPHFPPGKEGRAKYGDTNHQLLAAIIENVTGERIDKVLTALFRELGLPDSFVYDEAHTGPFIPIRYKSERVHLPLFFDSTRTEIFSTAQDQMTFLRAFFDGAFIPRERLHELKQWNRVFFPFHYGIGIQRFSLPRLLSPFHPVPEMVGHCGSTGAIAFYIPERDLYITGTTNQQARPNVAFQTAIKILRAVTLS